MLLFFMFLMQTGEHPKPVAQVIFIVENFLIFAIGVLFTVCWIMLLAKGAVNIAKIFFGIISIALLIMPILGCFGSRFGISCDE